MTQNIKVWEGESNSVKGDKFKSTKFITNKGLRLKHITLRGVRVLKNETDRHTGGRVQNVLKN
jgi:hypothetical protein